MLILCVGHNLPKFGSVTLTIHHSIKSIGIVITLQFDVQIWKFKQEQRQDAEEVLLFHSFIFSLFSKYALFASEPGLSTARSLCSSLREILGTQLESAMVILSLALEPRSCCGGIRIGEAAWGEDTRITYYHDSFLLCGLPLLVGKQNFAIEFIANTQVIIFIGFFIIGWRLPRKPTTLMKK